MKGVANEIMARRTANEVLDLLGVDRFPVDPEAVAATLHIPVAETPGFPPHCFGALSLTDSQFRILISDACPTRGLRRFTVAHEIGHASMDHHTEAMNWVNHESGTQIALSEGHYRSAKDVVEVEADHFASELLMPQRWAQPLVDQLPPGIEAIRTLAERFDTSLTSAAVRYAGLSAPPLLVVLSRGTVIEWVSPSREVAHADFFRYNPMRAASLPRRCATSRLADDPDGVRSCREATSSGHLCEWFPRAPRDVTVEIDAVGLGSYGRVLTLILCSDFPEADELYLREQAGAEDPMSEQSDWRTTMRREAGYGA
jgi:hypothetical protein